MANTYQIGDLVTVIGTLTDSDGDELDATETFAEYKEPDGTIVTYEYGEDDELEKVAVGVYHVDISVDAAGIWSYRFYSTGTGQGASEGYFRVQRSEFV